MNRTKQVKRGEIYMISIDETIKGSEQGGYRPGVIIQNDIGNKFSPTTIVAFITSRLNKRHLPTHVNVSDCGLYIESTVMLEQIRTIDKDRLVNYVGMADTHTMTQINNALKISLGLEE